MKRDSALVRPNKPVEFVNCKTGEGVERVAGHIARGVLFDRPVKVKRKK
jgi:urease accessory protein